MNAKFRTAASAALILFFLTACKGGGGGDDETSPPSTTNTPPTISGNPIAQLETGSSYSFTPTAEDSDRDLLTFSITNKPEWASFDSTTGQLSGTPTDQNLGPQEDITISVTDGKSSPVPLKAFSILVLPAVPIVETTLVTSTASALVSTPVDLSEYALINGFSDNKMNAEGKGEIAFAIANKGQSVFISTDDGDPIAVAYFSKEQIQSGDVDIAVENIADGLIITNPSLDGASAKDKELILDAVKKKPEYVEYLSFISTQLANNPTQLLNEQINLRVYEDAFTLVNNAIDSLRQSEVEATVNAFEAKTESTLSEFYKEGYPSPIVGDPFGPYLADEPGENIIVVNPMLVFYGVAIDKDRFQLVPPRKTIWGFFNKEDAYPIQERVPLGNGGYAISLNKFGGPYKGRVAFANTFKILCVILDAYGYCPIKDETIVSTAELTEPPSDILRMWGDDLDILMQDMSVGGFLWKFTNKFLAWNDENGGTFYDDFIDRIYKNPQAVDNVGSAVKGIRKFQKYAHKYLKAMKIISVAIAPIKVMPWATEFISAPIQRSWCIRQNGGTLSSETSCAYLPPTLNFSTSPENDIDAGMQVIFNGLATTDPTYDSSSLLYRWDFDGDGFVDTDWQSSGMDVFTYPEGGVYFAKLMVKNPDDLLGVLEKVVSVREPVLDWHPGYGDFKVTREFGIFGSSYAEYSAICVNEYGSSYQMADWNDIKSLYLNSGDMAAFVSGTGIDEFSAAVSRGGDVDYTSDRDYFASYHNHNKPSYYLDHEQINNNYLSLGSWWGDRHVLCVER